MPQTFPSPILDAHTSMQKNPWMKGEFSTPVEISELRVWNRKGFESRFGAGLGIRNRA